MAVTTVVGTPKSGLTCRTLRGGHDEREDCDQGQEQTEHVPTVCAGTQEALTVDTLGQFLTAGLSSRSHLGHGIWADLREVGHRGAGAEVEGPRHATNAPRVQ